MKNTTQPQEEKSPEWMKLVKDFKIPEYNGEPYRFTHGYNGRTFVLENYQKDYFKDIRGIRTGIGTRPHEVVGEVMEELPLGYRPQEMEQDVVICGEQDSNGSSRNPNGLVVRI